MTLKSWQAVLILIVSSIASAQSPEVSSIDPDHQTQNHTPLMATGTASGDVGYRREIHPLQEHVDEWNMYLLGLARFQEVDSKNPML